MSDILNQYISAIELGVEIVRKEDPFFKVNDYVELKENYGLNTSNIGVCLEDVLSRNYDLYVTINFRASKNLAKRLDAALLDVPGTERIVSDLKLRKNFSGSIDYVLEEQITAKIACRVANETRNERKNLINDLFQRLRSYGGSALTTESPENLAEKRRRKIVEGITSKLECERKAKLDDVYNGMYRDNP